jgi:hypothetical protein
MMRLSTIVPFLAGLSDKELGSLHRRLGGFLSVESRSFLKLLAEVTRSPLLAGKSLPEIAQLVGSPDPMDARRLAEDCAAYRADRNAELVLTQHRNTAAPSTEIFLSLLHYQAPRSPKIRAGLFQLWMRAEPKPTRGDISCMHMHDELPVLHWLLRDQAVEVFEAVVENHYHELQEFVLWFLGKASHHTEHFIGNYEYRSFNVYAFGRPRHAAWARLAQEVQSAAAGLGVSIPEEVRLPAMPDLESPTNACLIMSPARISRRRLNWLRDHLFVRDSSKSGRSW